MRIRVKAHKRKGTAGVKQHTRIILDEADRIRKRLLPYSKKITLAGSIRRKIWERGEAPNDIDMVLIPRDVVKIKAATTKLGRVISSGDKIISLENKGIRTDIFITKPEHYESTLMHATGPSGSNIKHRSTAKAKGWRLSQYGLFDGKGKKIAGTEKKIYKKLGLSYRKPEDRGEPRW